MNMNYDLARQKARISQASNKIAKLLDKYERRPFVVQFRKTIKNTYGLSWSSTSKSSFKHELEAIRRATKIRLGGVSDITIWRWHKEEQEWRPYGKD